MNLAHIELSKLVVSTANMRAKRKDRDIADLIPSVRARGVLVPLLVRPNGAPDTYEIVAGRRRYFAAKAVSESLKETMALPCAIMEAGDDAAAIEASLIENIERLDPDEVARWETFARLIKEGRSVEDIAATFGLAEAVVRRTLALGNLLPRILALYRSEGIDAGTVRSLTLATVAQQRAWLALFDSEDGRAPTGRALKAWLFGGATIPASVALFDLAEYTAPVIVDLFDDQSYFSDTALFWSLQTKAIAAKRQAYVTDGWSEVVVLDQGRWFDRWAYEKRAKRKGGRVYIAVGEGGAVEIHEGYLPRKEAERRDRKDNPPAAIARPELTAPLRRYLELHRHAAVRAELLDHSWIALRLVLAHVIAGSALWRVQVERQRADKAETRQSVANAKAQMAFIDRRAAAFTELGLVPDTPALVVDGGNGSALAFTFEALRHVDDGELLRLIPIIMGETLEAGGTAIEPLGTTLAVDIAAHWQADEAFFALLRDRSVLLALVAELAGPEAAHANSDASAKVLKAIMRDCLTGQNGRTKVESWAPRWLRFPPSTYLSGDVDPSTNAEEGDAEASDDSPDSVEAVESIDA